MGVVLGLNCVWDTVIFSIGGGRLERSFHMGVERTINRCVATGPCTSARSLHNASTLSAPCREVGVVIVFRPPGLSHALVGSSVAFLWL